MNYGICLQLTDGLCMRGRAVIWMPLMCSDCLKLHNNMCMQEKRYGFTPGNNMTIVTVL